MTIPICCNHKTVEAAIQDVLPKAKVHSITLISNKCPVRLFRIHLSKSDKVLNISIPMPSDIRLLRHESDLVHAEAALLTLLAKPVMPADLQGSVPSLIKHSSTALESGSQYNIVTSTEGVPYCALSEKLTTAEHCRIQTHIGTLQRQLSTIISPTGKFGRVTEVCSGAGFECWRDAFVSLLENVLRDGEDMSVNLPYERIRWHSAMWTKALDEVVVPRLVVLDAEDREKILIAHGSAQEVHVSGLRDWRQGIFGDPMILKCFEDPSPGFLNAWQTQQNPNPSVKEDSIKVRLLMYGCWRAVVEIVTEYFRPQNGSSERELDARKKLTDLLSKLDRCIYSDGDKNESRRAYSKSRVRPRLEAKQLLDKSLQPCFPVPLMVVNST